MKTAFHQGFKITEKIVDVPGNFFPVREMVKDGVDVLSGKQSLEEFKRSRIDFVGLIRDFDEQGIRFPDMKKGADLLDIIIHPADGVIKSKGCGLHKKSMSPAYTGGVTGRMARTVAGGVTG